MAAGALQIRAAYLAAGSRQAKAATGREHGLGVGQEDRRRHRKPNAALARNVLLALIPFEEGEPLARLFLNATTAICHERLQTWLAATALRLEAAGEVLRRLARQTTEDPDEILLQPASG